MFIIYCPQTQSEYVRSDIEDTKKSLKDTIVPAVSSITCHHIVCITY